MSVVESSCLAYLISYRLYSLSSRDEPGRVRGTPEATLGRREEHRCLWWHDGRRQIFIETCCPRSVCEARVWHAGRQCAGLAPAHHCTKLSTAGSVLHYAMPREVHPTAFGNHWLNVLRSPSRSSERQRHSRTYPTIDPSVFSPSVRS